MRLVDVCIPHFDDEDNSRALSTLNTLNTFQLPTNLFGQNDLEYNVEDGDDDTDHSNDGLPSMQEEQFFEAEDGTATVSVEFFAALCIPILTYISAT